jgi:hypothetical protein
MILAPVSQGKYGETMEKMLDMYGNVWTCPKMDGLEWTKHHV